MVKINHKNFCENCFAETGKEPCPVCGYSKAGYSGDPMTLSPGSILAGRYAIGRVIGKGGFGMTYLAYDMKLECKVAIKEYYPRGLAMRNPGSTFVSVSDTESEITFKEGAGKFYDEARLVAKFNGNPNIVSVYDFFYENDTVYFTMGYLDGMTLKSYIKEYGALSLAQAVYVAESVSNALMAAHSLNVLHRDISPDNIMVCKDGTVKLLDFGAARQVVTEGSQSLSVILKQGFAPLEQYQKKGKQGPWTDIYSLGATLYHALTLDILDDPMSRLEDDEEYSSNSHQIADEFWRIIKKATALRIQDRYRDIFELKKDLNCLPVKSEFLIEPEMPVEARNWGPTAKVFGNTGRDINTAHAGNVSEAKTVGVTMPLQEDKNERTALPQSEEVGMTVPLREADTVSVTMPLREEETVGVTMPLREEKTVGMTMPLREEETVGMTMPLKQEDTDGITVPLREVSTGKNETLQKTPDETEDMEAGLQKADQEQQAGKETENGQTEERKAWYETKWNWLFAMPGMAAVQIVTMVVLYLVFWSREPYRVSNEYMRFYAHIYYANILIPVITATEWMIFFAFDLFYLRRTETGSRAISSKGRVLLLAASAVANVVIATIVVYESGWWREVNWSQSWGIVAVAIIGSGIVFGLDAFILRPAEMKMDIGRIRKSRIILFAILTAISLVMMIMTLRYCYLLEESRLSRDIYSYYVVPLMAVLEEGILLVTLDAVSVKQNTKKTERKLYGIQWNAILLYFSLFQLQVWYGMNGIGDGGYKEFSYRDSEELKNLVVFFIVELLVSEVIFLLYLKKSRICAILVSIWAVYEICFVGYDITDNLYVFVFAFLSLTVVWQTFRYHRAEKNHQNIIHKS